MKGSAEHSRCTCVDRPLALPMNNYTTKLRTENAFEKKTTACVSLFVFFTIRRGTFQYIIEDDCSSTSQTPTTHDTNTCVKLTIVTDLSFSERIAIANLSSYIPVRTSSFYSSTCSTTSSISHLTGAHKSWTFIEDYWPFVPADVCR